VLECIDFFLKGKWFLAQTHEPTNSTDLFICFQSLKEFEECGGFWFQPTVDKDAVLWVKLFTEASQKPEVRIEFTSIFEFNTVKYVKVFFIKNFFFIKICETKFVFIQF